MQVNISLGPKLWEDARGCVCKLAKLWIKNPRKKWKVRRRKSAVSLLWWIEKKMAELFKPIKGWDPGYLAQLHQQQQQLIQQQQQQQKLNEQIENIPSSQSEGETLGQFCWIGLWKQRRSCEETVFPFILARWLLIIGQIIWTFCKK